ncbi:MAG: hypothetical protein L0Z07_08470, partial [Planctomycetes bacterium]|nr:hypothetical protein [Planctomycetota bacterium]
MAGKTRFATIFVALPSLLAAGGGAAHYYANGGKLPFAASFARFTATANPGEKQAAEAEGLHISAADLDAVEGAWAGTNGTNDSMSHPARSAQATADSSQIARSAGVVLAQAEMPAKTGSTPTDRYAIPAEVPSPAVVPAGTDPSIYGSTMRNPEDAPASPANAVYAGSPQATANNSEYSAGNRDGISTAAEPEVADEFDHAGSRVATSGSPPSAVTRGQEPNEPAASSKRDIADQPGANPLRTIPTDANENVAEDDAREAFSDKSPPAAGDRYSNSATAPRSLDPTAQQTA